MPGNQCIAAMLAKMPHDLRYDEESLSVVCDDERNPEETVIVASASSTPVGCDFLQLAVLAIRALR